MAATITDYFNNAADGNGTYPTLGVVQTTRAAGEAVLACEDLTGWTTETPVHFSTYKLASDGTVDTTTQTDWKGIVSGNTITNLTWIAGAEDTGNSIGDYVELNPTIGWLDDLITGILVSLLPNGTLKDSIVTSAKLASSAVSSAKIADLAVTTAKINNGAITGVSNSATAIGTAKLALSTVGTPNLRDSAVSTAKIAASAVTQAKLAATALYSNSTGTTGTVTLSDSAANYAYLEIFYRTNDDYYGSVKVYSPNGKKAMLNGAYWASGSGSFKGAVKNISGTSITTTSYGEMSTSGYIHNNYIYITRVVGYK